jgi:hypothetical protein
VTDCGIAYGAQALWRRSLSSSRRSNVRPGSAGKPRAGRSEACGQALVTPVHWRAGCVESRTPGSVLEDWSGKNFFGRNPARGSWFAKPLGEQSPRGFESLPALQLETAQKFRLLRRLVLGDPHPGPCGATPLPVAGRGVRTQLTIFIEISYKKYLSSDIISI